MILIISCVVLLIVGTIILVGSYDYEELGIAISAFSIFWLLIFLIMLPIYYYGVESEIRGYESTIESIENAREADKDFENAAIQQKIIDANKWLSEQQYWNESIWDIYTPDEIMELKPIK